MLATFSVTSSVTTRAAAGGVNLDFDATLFVQVGFIIVLWLVLKPLLFDPMLKLFEEREKRTEGAIKKARRIDDESTAARSEYENAVAKGRAAGSAERERLRAESLRKESDLLANVRAETQKKLDAARAEVSSEVATARGALGPATREIAKQVASRVLGREVA